MLPLWRDGEAGGGASDAARHSASPARGVPPSRARAADPLAARSRGRGYTLLRTEGARAQARAREDVGTSPRGWDERERCVRRARGALNRSKDDASRAGKRDVPRGRGALPATHQVRGHVARGIQQVRCRTRAEEQGSAARQRRGGPRRQERRARGSRARRPRRSRVLASPAQGRGRPRGRLPTRGHQREHAPLLKALEHARQYERATNAAAIADAQGGGAARAVAALALARRVRVSSGAPGASANGTHQSRQRLVRVARRGQRVRRARRAARPARARGIVCMPISDACFCNVDS